MEDHGVKPTNTQMTELEYLQGLVDRIREALNDKYKHPHEKISTIRHLVGEYDLD